MAQPNSNPHQDMGITEEQKLQYLEFVQVAAIHSVMSLYKVYSQAKERSGPLRSGVDAIEGTVITVVAPVYHNLHHVPAHALYYLDTQVHKSVNELERRVPPVLKQVSSQALSTARKAPEVAREMALEVNRGGVVDTASGIAKSVYSKYEPAAKELYTKLEPIAEQTAVSVWQKLNKLPLFPQMAQVVMPTASYCTHKYNDTVRSTAEKGYRLSSYLPLVPTQRIAKVFANDSTPLISE